MSNQDSFCVYLADDDEDDRMLFADAVRRISQSITVDTSNNGEQLLAKVFAADPLPDVVFLDLNMPRKNGLECLNALRADQKTQQLPVVVISTSSATEIVSKAKLHGADYYIQKPDDFFMLKQLIETGLRLSRNGDKAERTFFLNHAVSQPAPPDASQE